MHKCFSTMKCSFERLPSMRNRLRSLLDFSNSHATVSTASVKVEDLDTLNPGSPEASTQSPKLMLNLFVLCLLRPPAQS